MKLNVFIKENCDFCSQIVIPEGINVESIDIDKDYDGFKPVNVPVLQYNGMNFEGPVVINSILNLVKSSQDGDYKG